MFIRHITHATVLGALLLCWAPMSSASSLLGIYAGIAAGHAEIKDTSPKQDSTTSKVYAGYRILGPIAVEVSNVDLGDYYSGAATVDGIAADLVLFLPAGPINLFAKAGIFNWNVDYNGAAPAESGTDSKTGMGVEYNMLLNIDLRVEWEHYSSVSDSDINMLSVGLNIAF